MGSKFLKAPCGCKAEIYNTDCIKIHHEPDCDLDNKSRQKLESEFIKEIHSSKGDKKNE